MATIFELVVFAFISGFAGDSLGKPLGEYFFEKFVKPRLEHGEGIIKKMKTELKNGGAS
jgi:hypothetical protein